MRLFLPSGSNKALDRRCTISRSFLLTMLGITTTPTGDTKPQVEKLLPKSKQWSTRVNHGNLSAYEALMTFKQGIMASISYPVGVITLSRKQCDLIQSLAICVTLTKLEVTSKISRAIVHGPLRYGGLTLSNLHTESVIQKIQLMMGHIRKNDMTGNIFRTALCCLQ